MNLLIKLIIFLSCAVFASAVDCGAANPCQNSGTCNSGTCACPSGFTGDLCEITISFDFNADTSFQEDQGTFVITITRVETNYDLSLTITTSGTAGATDFSLSSLSSSLGNGVSERLVILTIANDNIPEPDETIIVTMTHTDGTAVSKTYTILKNDPLVVHTSIPPTIKEQTPSTSINLGSTFFTFGVNTPVLVPITVTVSSVSGAVLGTDYTVSEASQSLTFTYDDSNQAATTALLTAFVISFPDDNVPEADKTISIDFTSDYELGGSTSTPITIDDNDGIDISVPGLSTSVTEGDSFNLADTTFLFLPSRVPSTITVTAKVVSGTAVLGTDFTTSPASGQVTFTYDPADASTRASLDAFTVTISQDSTVEVDKAFQLVFESAVDIIGDPTLDITITDDDPETITLQGPDSVDEDQGTATYTLTRQTPIRPVTVTYTIRAAPINTALYNTNVREEAVPIVFAVGETVKTFDVTLEDDNEVQIPKSFTVSAEGTLVADITDKTVTIVEDDDYEVTFSGVTVSEGDPAVLTFTRDSSVNTLTVTLTTTAGTATAPADYTAQIAASVTFPDGSLTVDHSIPTTEDSTYEPQEAFTVTMSGSRLKASSTTTPVTITINDDDVETLTAVDGSVNENGGPFTLSIVRTATFEALTVTVETQIPSGVPHPITAGDITARSGVAVNFPIGSATATFTVNIVNDGDTEADETFDVFIDAPNPIADVTATVTIVNDDDYTVTFNEPTVTEGGTAVITLTRDVTAGPLSVTVTTSDNTAVAPTDYTALSAAAFTFADGSATASATVDIATTADNAHEAQESFFFDLASTQPLTSSRGTVTITDDDPEVLTLSGPDSVSESDLTATIGITRTGTFEQLIVTATILIPSSGNPITLSDLITGVTTSVTFPVGTASVDFVVNIVNDELFELDEDFQVHVSAPSITPVVKTVTITNDDDYGVAFANAAANEGNPVTVSFARDSAVGPLTILVSTADGTATAGSDYTALSSSPVVFADGSLIQTLDITTAGDSLYEADETFTVSIITAGLKASSTGSATMTITNDDVEVLTVTGGGTVNEAVQSKVLQITRTNSFEPLTVTAEIVSSGVMASRTLPIGTLTDDFTLTFADDDLFELDEDILIRFTAPAPIAPVETTVTIVNDDLYGITVSDVTVDEGNSATVTFTRDSSVGALVVNVATADGTAVSASDYTAQSQSLTFADGASTVDVVIPTVDDNLFEADETFTVSLSSATSLKASSTLTATVTITNDDSYDVAFTGATVEEGEPLRVTFTRDSSVGALTIIVTATDGTATAGSDFTAVSATSVTFADGAPTAFIDITVTEDNAYEPTETFTISITSSSSLTAASLTPRTFTITDDDVEVITVTGGGSVMENAGTVTVTVSRTSSFETLATIVNTELPISGTPISPSDIQMLTNFPLNFGVGTSTATVTVTINNDELYEMDESFLVKVDAVPNTIVDKEVLVTIQNDDLYEVTFSGSSVTEGNNLDVVFTRDSPIGSLDISLSTTDGTAAGGSDYTALTSDTVTFADGSSTVTKTIMISDDNVYEPTENFVVSMTSTETLKPSSTASATFDINDNDVEVLSITGNTDVNEEDGNVTLTINRQGDFEVLTVTASTIIPPGEPYPIEAGDIVMRTGVSLTFGIGTTTVEFTVDIVDDDVAEADEKFGVEVTAPAPVASVTETVTILNNDPDTVTFEPFLALYEDGQTKFVRISRTVDDKAVTVSVNSQDMTATGGVDYVILSNFPVTFPVGSLETTFPVRILNDAFDEIDERFRLVVSGPTVKTTPPKDFIIVDNEGSRPFDCRRKGQDCVNETDICTPDIPLCQCVGMPAREGDNCNVVIEQKNGTACITNNVDCNNGTCVDEAGVAYCRCDDGYYGDNCQHYFLQAVCTNDNMTLVANPDGNFQGKIYVEEKVDVPECTANPVPNPPQPNDYVDDNLLGWFLTIAHDDAVCDPISPQEDAVYISYVRKVIIQYNNDTLTGVDQRVTISCRVPKDNYLVHAAVIRVDRNIPLVEESASNRFSPLELEIDLNGVIIFNYHTVAIAQKLCITISVPPAFGGLEITDIEFNNTFPSDPKRWPVLTEGCRLDDVEAVLVDDPFYPTGNRRTIRFCFYAFKFTNSFQLTVQTTLKICLNDTLCSQPTCPQSRAKRQAGETQQQDVDATFNIVVPSVSGTVTRNQSSEVTIVRAENECSLPMHFIPTVVCLGLLVFLLVLLCLFLTYLLSRRRRKSEEKEEPEPVATRIIPQWLVFRR